MFSAETEKLIAKAINEEYKNAVENYGEKYNSLHEGYAVLKEEIEEVEYELRKIKYVFEVFWESCVKGQGEASEMHAEKIKNIAIKLMLEACQVAAVCEKIAGGEK